MFLEGGGEPPPRPHEPIFDRLLPHMTPLVTRGLDLDRCFEIKKAPAGFLHIFHL